MIRGDFLPELRADDHKRFFDLRDVEPCTAKTIEQNFDFVVEIVATLAVEPVWMAHAGWKAGELLSLSLKSLRLSQAVFRKLADRYAVFPAKTKKKVVADRFISNVGYFNYPKCCVYVGLVDRIFNIGQDWASVTSGNARSLCLHAMTLASRSGGARWEHCCLEWLLPKC